MKTYDEVIKVDRLKAGQYKAFIPESVCTQSSKCIEDFQSALTDNLSLSWWDIDISYPASNRTEL